MYCVALSSPWLKYSMYSKSLSSEFFCNHCPMGSNTACTKVSRLPMALNEARTQSARDSKTRTPSPTVLTMACTTGLPRRPLAQLVVKVCLHSRSPRVYQLMALNMAALQGLAQPTALDTACTKVFAQLMALSMVCILCPSLDYTLSLTSKRPQHAPARLIW